MSSCLTGGSSRAYGFDLEMLKSPSTSTITSHSSSSPSSTLSESSNSPHAISTRKPRTPRKRPNQTYNEAAALLSTAYPNIFSAKHLTQPCKFTRPQASFWDESSDLFLPFRVFDNNSCLLLHQPIPEKKPNSQTEPRVVNSREKLSFQGHRQVENDFRVENDFPLCGGYQEDFDAESMLDEEIGEGIDSIMGNLSVSNDSVNESNVGNFSGSSRTNASCYGYPIGLGFGGKVNFGFGLGMRRALRHVDDEGDWWRFPTVDVIDISPKLNKSPTEKKKKKVEKALVESKALESPPPRENPTPKQQNENSIPKPSAQLLLKLNYDEVADAWSDRGSPFDEILRHEMAGNNFHVCLSSSPAGNSNS